MDVIEQTIEPVRIGEGRLVTARSFLIDRIVPQCETVLLPELTLRPGTLRLESGAVRLVPRKKRRLSAFLPKPDQRVPEGRWAFDMRRDDPENWAHFLNDHLPLFFHASETTGRDPRTALLLLPSDVPSYIARVAAVFGLEVWATDAVVEGEGIDWELTPGIANRTARVGWARLAYPRSVMDDLMARPASSDLPKKIFVTRNKRRAVSNQDEIEALLAVRGFVPILPEALPPEDQFRLYLNADEVVAVSGASLAPLLYTLPPGQGPSRLIELQPCGHMSSVYREMTELVGSRWGGVRGRIRPEYIRPAYAFDRPFRKFSQDAFEVDPESLALIFDMTGG